MSKLSDKIRRATRLQSHGLGFGSTRDATEATMLLVAVAPDAQAAAGLASRGADAVIVEMGDGSRASDAPSSNRMIAGARISGRADNEAKTCKEAGFDFVVFDPDQASATALLEENIGYVLAAPADLSDTEWRTLEGFQLDAIDIGAIDGAMTVRRQIDLRRIYAMTRKPLMATVGAGISPIALQALRDTNVVVVVAQDAGAIEPLRKAIDGLPPRSRRKDGEDRPVPLVPHNAAMGGDEDEHDHDHDG